MINEGWCLMINEDYLVIVTCSHCETCKCYYIYFKKKVLATIKTKGRSFTSSHKETAAWYLLQHRHLPMQIIRRLPFSSAQIVNLCAKHFCHQIHAFLLLFKKLSISLLPPFSFHGHFIISGNELADRASKEVTAITANTILPASLWSILQVIN